MRLLLVSLTAAGLALAQVPNPTQQATPAGQPGESVPLYRVTVVGRTTQAVNYRFRSGSTEINLVGTALMPEARGKAEVESKTGRIEVEVDFKNVGSPQKYGPEYLTFVLWAITPEGRATNMGEVVVRDGRSKMEVTTELQAFGMIVTAEPYFGVSQPSDVVVMENEIRPDTKGKWTVVDAKYELLQRGQYTFQGAAKYRPLGTDSRTPSNLLQARNAVQIAQLSGADRYATDTYEKAVTSLKQAEDYLIRKQGDKPVGTAAREAVQTAEDARIIALKRIEEERLTAERQAAAAREAAAKAATAEQARQRAAAEEQQRLEAQRRAQAEADRANAERAQLAAERARTEADRLRADADRQRAEAEAATRRAGEERAAAERAKAEADAARQRLAVEADAAKQAAAASEAERARLRQQLLDQFNLILETRDTARGLIINLSDVLFDSGKYTLRPAAREKLARVGGIVLAYPGLRLEAEGHTDSVGSDEMNQRLSENRANTVRDYLTSQGVPAANLTARGFGETTPVASNDNAAGRQQNRRVELVVSGEVIGTSVSSLKTPTTQTQQ